MSPHTVRRVRVTRDQRDSLDQLARRIGIVAHVLEEEGLSDWTVELMRPAIACRQLVDEFDAASRVRCAECSVVRQSALAPCPHCGSTEAAA